MRHHLLLSLATVALLSAACSQTPETIVAGTGTETDTVAEQTVPGQRPANDVTTTSRPDNTQTQAEPEDEPAEQQPNDSSSTTAPPIDQESDPSKSIDDRTSWQDRPLARVVLTGDDLSALGLRSGWEVDQIGFVEIDNPYESDEAVCGTAIPAQTSYFEASFEQRDLGTALELNVMPASTDPNTPSAFLAVLQLLATCPDLEGDMAAVSMEIVTVDVAGADQSLVIAGVDATSPAEPIGLTLAAAVVDDHLFMAFVVQDSGVPASRDAALAVKAVELSISRL